MGSKLRFFVVLLSVSLLQVARAKIERYEESIARVETDQSPENVRNLGGHLRGVARYNRPPDSSPYYQRIQNLILSIPGHADFFAKPIWESYEAYRDPTHPRHTGSADWFTQEAQYGLETLKHLPSPETVKVLGEMLEEEWQKVPNPLSDVLVPSALGKQAAWTLLELPLRDMPTRHFKRYEAMDYLPAWQKWYEKVRSGELAFSFVGQPMEYRFQADGSVTSTPIEIPKEELEEAEAAEREQNHPKDEGDEGSKFVEDPVPSSGLYYWVWGAFGIAAVIVISGFLAMRRKS